jgi:hypothetical protein
MVEAARLLVFHRMWNPAVLARLSEPVWLHTKECIFIIAILLHFQQFGSICGGLPQSIAFLTVPVNHPPIFNNDLHINARFPLRPSIFSSAVRESRQKYNLRPTEPRRLQT